MEGFFPTGGVEPGGVGVDEDDVAGVKVGDRSGGSTISNFCKNLGSILALL